MVPRTALINLLEAHKFHCKGHDPKVAYFRREHVVVMVPNGEDLITDASIKRMLAKAINIEEIDEFIAMYRRDA